MKVISTEIPDVLLLEPHVFQDERGYFLETWNARTFRNEIKLDVQFVQDNHSRSGRDVLRGLHYQIKQPQGKLVRVVRGQVFDVAIDSQIRPTFGRWVAMAQRRQPPTTMDSPRVRARISSAVRGRRRPL